MSDEQIKQMVKLFLSWPLPEDFYPDNGIQFNPFHKGFGGKPIRNVPVGTNLFTATQAEDMIRYLAEGIGLVATDRNSDTAQANPPLSAPTNTDEQTELDEILKTTLNDFYDYMTEPNIIVAAHEYSEKIIYKKAKAKIAHLIVQKQMEELEKVVLKPEYLIERLTELAAQLKGDTK